MKNFFYAASAIYIFIAFMVFEPTNVWKWVASALWLIGAGVLLVCARVAHQAELIRKETEELRRNNQL